MRVTVALVLALALGVACKSAPPPPPPATPAPEPASPAAAASDPEGAKQAYMDGRAAYEKGQYKEALASFEHADKLHHDALLLFNIAQSQRQLGQHQAALEAYRKYLAEQPEAKNRKMVEQKIEEMEKAVHGGAKASK